MIAVLKEAADVAADAGDAFNHVHIRLCRAGFTIVGSVQALQGKTTFTETVLWRDLLDDPQALLSGVARAASAVNRWRDEKPAIKALSASEKPVVRLIQPEEWPLAIVSALAILIAIPLGGGWLL